MCYGFAVYGWFPKVTGVLGLPKLPERRMTLYKRQHTPEDA